MDKPKQVNFTRRLISGFSILVLIFILFALFTIYDIYTVSNLTHTICNHPLAVSNAALQSNVSITKMHRDMKDVVLFTSPSEINRYINAVNEQEKQVYKYLDMVKNSITGNEGKMLENEARKLFADWRPIREEVIEFVRQGEKEIAAGITIGKGANHVALLEEKMLGLMTYARGKASDLMHEAGKVRSKFNLALIIFLLSGILASFLVAFFTIRRISSSEKALRESEEDYRELSDSLPQIVFETDEKGNLIFTNLMAVDILGYTREDFEKGLNTLQMLIPEDHDRALRNIQKVLKGEKLGGTEYTVLTKDGRRYPAMLYSTPIISEGKSVGMRGIVGDLTEVKQAQKALLESEEKYRTILESIEDGYFEVDIAGNFTFFNDSLCKIGGYSKDELMGMNSRQYTDEENAKKLYQAFNRVYTAGKPDRGFVWEIIRKDGTKIAVEASISLRSDAGGEPIGFRGVIRDISEKQRLEAQLQQTQKMEAIATLAGGIAHEFNNALMGIMGNLELLKMDLPEDERRNKSFEAMKDSGHRMSRLTNQLLAYAQGGKYQGRDLKLDDFVIEALPILQHDLNPEVRVETRFQKDISYIRADHALMQMVLSAIVANSNEAIEDEGVIRIAAENKDIDEDFTKQHPGLNPGPYVCLTIKDDGKGMDEETKDGIFEPFFTTKFRGRGMGMAAVYGIIKSHDGAITVDSEPGKGTVVRIYLPAIEAKEEVKKEVGKVEIAMGEGTILVIDDEEPLVDLFRQILEKLGYRVLVAETGKEAVALAKTFDGQIDLALLDIKLPDMDGGRVYPLIMEARPDMKVIVCSGYNIHGPPQDILDAGAEGFIQKPFSIALFAEKLKAVLEGE